MLLLRVSAMRMGRRVPRSPKEPDISERGERRMVERLWRWVWRRERVRELRWIFSAARGRNRRPGRALEGWSML